MEIKTNQQKQEKINKAPMRELYMSLLDYIITDAPNRKQMLQCLKIEFTENKTAAVTKLHEVLPATIFFNCTYACFLLVFIQFMLLIFVIIYQCVRLEILKSQFHKAKCNYKPNHLGEHLK